MADESEPLVPETGESTRTVNNIFYNNWGGFTYVFLAALMLQLSHILCPIFLRISGKPVPGFMQTVLFIVSFILFAGLTFMYFNRTALTADRTRFEGLSRSILSSAAGIAFLYMISLLFAIIYKNLIKYLPVLQSIDGKALLFLAAVMGIVIVMAALLLAGVVLLTAVFEYRLPIAGMGKVFLILLPTLLKRIPRLLFYGLIAAAMLYLDNIVLLLLERISDLYMPQGYYCTYILSVVSALTSGYVIFVLLNMGRKILMGRENAIIELSAKPSRFRVPVFAIIVLVLCVIMTFMLVPPFANSADAIIAESQIHVQKAEVAGQLGLAQKQIYEYDLAYSKVLSLKAYLEGLKYLKTEDRKDYDASMADMNMAGSLSAKNPYVPYFNGHLKLLNKDYGGAVDSFRTTLRYSDGVTQAWLGMLEAYRLSDQREKANEAIKVAAAEGIYYDSYADLRRLSKGRLDKYIERLGEIEATLGPTMAYKAYEKTKYMDGQGAYNELVALQQKYTDNALVAYYAAKAASFYKNEQYNYETAKKTIETFYRLTSAEMSEDEEVNRALFTARTYFDANDMASAEKILAEAYSKYPGEVSVIEQYTYTLYKEAKYDDALKLLDTMLKDKPDNYRGIYLSALCLAGKQDAAGSLSRMAQLLDVLNKDNGKAQVMDECLYSYSLVFSKTFSAGLAYEELEKYNGNKLLYNYMLAIKGWKEHNAESSNEYIAKVLEVDGKLGYALYIMGVNYYEDTVRNNRTDFSKAEEYYKQSLDIIPDHAEGYFALAHCYKKWGKNQEALRAFRKVVDLMPYEDHRLDPYGITVHAIGEISVLSQSVREGE